MEWIGTYYFRQRVNTIDSANFGLYPKWKPYVAHISSLISFLATRSITVFSGRASIQFVDQQQGMINAFVRFRARSIKKPNVGYDICFIESSSTLKSQTVKTIPLVFHASFAGLPANIDCR